MKIAFFGTAEIALPSLEALIKSRHEVLCVVTQPDRKKGRGLKVSEPLTKGLALKNNIDVMQPKTLGDKNFLRALKALSPELIVVVAYGKILIKEVLQIPKIYCINVHTSLLPKYRGAAPVNWAIICGEKVTGVTIFKMDEHMDSGPIILQSKLDIEEEDTASTLSHKLGRLGAELLLDVVGLIKEGKVELLAQDDSKATLAPLLKKKDGLIDWSKSSIEIHNLVRGMDPWPSAFIHLKGKRIKIWRTRPVEGKGKEPPGTVTQVRGEDGILVATGDGQILITELQLEGKKRMRVSQFLLGHSVKIGERLI